MATEKIFFPVLVMLFLFLFVKGNGQSKYNQTTTNFLDTNTNIKSVSQVSIKDAVDYVHSLIDGEIISAEKKFKKNLLVWEIKLITYHRGIILFEVSAIDKTLIKLSAEEGPFDYEINNSYGIVAYSIAKKTAEDQSGQKTLKWNFFRNKDKWEYNFWLFTKSGKAQLRIDAESGEIIKKKK